MILTNYDDVLGENHLLEPPTSQLQQVWGLAFPTEPAAPKRKSRKRKALGTSASSEVPISDVAPPAPSSSTQPVAQIIVSGTDELQIEDTQAHQAKMGKWKKDASLAVQDKDFIDIVVAMLNAARKPLHRFFLWMQKQEVMIKLQDQRGYRQVGLMAQLVWFKAKEVSDALYELTNICNWAWLLDRADLGMRKPITDCILLITVQHHADFQHRVFQPTHSFPLVILWIARRMPDTVCEDRRRVCRQILDTDDHMLHIIALKLKRFSNGALTYASNTGKCHWGLFGLVSMWVIAMPCDAQSIEGLNNQISSAVRFAPAIGLPLLSARIVARFLAFHNVDLGMKYSLLKGCRIKQKKPASLK